jgi:hypothetical protein
MLIFVVYICLFTNSQQLLSSSSSGLLDKVADNKNEVAAVTLATGFRGITYCIYWHLMKDLMVTERYTGFLQHLLMILEVWMQIMSALPRLKIEAMLFYKSGCSVFTLNSIVMRLALSFCLCVDYHKLLVYERLLIWWFQPFHCYICEMMPHSFARLVIID